MLNFKVANGEVVAVSSEFPEERDGWMNRNDFKELQQATAIAEQATKVTGTLHIAEDRGAYTSPRYDVVRVPAVGDEVSYAFNGDYYPDGTIVSISKSLKVITTSTGKKYYKRGARAQWVNAGTWTLVQGHISRLNPSF